MRILLAGALFVSCLAASARVSAQLVVLRVDPAAERLSVELERALENYGLLPDPGYFAEARRHGLDPQSDQALGQLTPPLRARLAVVPRAEDPSSALIEFRDGASGASLGSVSIPLLNGTLADAGRAALDAAVQARLGPGAANVSPSAAGGTVGSSASADADAAQGSPAAGLGVDGGSPALLVTLSAGLGAGTRSLAWPSSRETLALSTGVFPAVELGARAAVVLSSGFALGPELSYETSLHAKLRESHIAGADASLAVRAERFAAVLAATFSFGAHAGFQLAPAFGIAIRALRPEVHQLLTPAYSLAGPVAQVRSRIAFADEVALVLAPELHYALVSEALRERGIEKGALSVGAEAAFELVLSAHFTLALTYREAHALLHSSLGSGASDVERFFTVRLQWGM